MKVSAGNRFRKVGVCLEASSVSLAVRNSRRAGLAVCRKSVEVDARSDIYRDALSELVARAGVAGARCMAALPVARCRVGWVGFTGMRLRDLRTAVGHSAFWQAHLGVTLESHRVWWCFIRNGGQVGALIAAAPREEVDFYTSVIRAARLNVGAVGVSCFDYFDGELQPQACKATLVLDCENACVIAAGAFGVRVRAVGLDADKAVALLSTDGHQRDAVVDELTVCIRRCVEDEGMGAHAIVRIVAAQGINGDWLELLRERLPRFTVELIDGWTAAGLEVPNNGACDEPRNELERLPRAAARLVSARRGVFRQRRTAPAVDFAVRRADSKRRLRRLLSAAAAVGCLLVAVSAYVNGLLLAEHRRLRTGAEQYAQLQQTHDRALAEIKTLQRRLSNRISFYSGIQHVSFERKLMPHLLASIEHAAFEGIWLNSVFFSQPGFLRIAGKSLGDEQIARFIRVCDRRM